MDVKYPIGQLQVPEEVIKKMYLNNLFTMFYKNYCSHIVPKNIFNYK